MTVVGAMGHGPASSTAARSCCKRALISWVSPDPYNPLVRMLAAATEPVLAPLRRLVPPRKLGGLDLSPLVAILLIQFVKNGIVYSLGYSPRFLF